MARNRDEIIKSILKLTEVANRSREALQNDDQMGASHEDLVENATRKIAKMMRRHQIDMADIEAARSTKDEKFVRFTFAASNSHGLGSERTNALHWAVIMPFGASSMFTQYKSARQDTQVTVFAPASIVEMLKAFMYSISLQLEMGLQEAVKAERKELDKRYWLTQAQRNKEILLFRRGYIRAFGATVGSRINAVQQEAMEEAKRELEREGRTLNSSTELVLANSSEGARKALHDWYFTISGGGKVKVATNRRQASNTGRAAGARDGRKANIEQPTPNPKRAALA